MIDKASKRIYFRQSGALEIIGGTIAFTLCMAAIFAFLYVFSVPTVECGQYFVKG